MNLSVFASIACFLALSAPRASAQSVNLDMGDVNVPSSSFGGAASQPGIWNRIGVLSSQSFTALLDRSGAPVPGLFSYGSSSLNPGVPGGVDLPGTTGDDELLLDDWLKASGPWTFYISQLQPGTYDVYVYAMSAGNTVTVQVNGGAVQPVTGAWSGVYTQGVTHARETLTIGTNPTLTIAVGGFSGVSGVQLVRHDTPYEVLCGSGGPVACPCPPGSAANGCSNSFSGNGTRLTAVGIASSTAANDTLTLQTVGSPDGPGLYFQGTAQIGPQTFGDGLRCVGGSVTRLGLVSSVGSATTFPSPGGTPISQLGGVTPGAARHYQFWYRDAATYCTAATFNLSNAVSVTWQ